MLLEVEVETLEQAEEAMAAGADRLLLDNFTVDAMRDAVALRDRQSPRTTLEASGGIHFETLRPVADTGVDFISIGALTKNIRAVDLSMRFRFAMTVEILPCPRCGKPPGVCICDRVEQVPTPGCGSSSSSTPGRRRPAGHGEAGRH